MNEFQEVAARIWEDLIARPSGPFGFRYVLQPLAAAALALRDGIRDARSGRRPYVWALLSERGQRGERLLEGLKATARIIVLGLAIDAAYQLKALGTFYPGEAVVVALLLGFVPYLLLRGPADRAARRWIVPRTPQPPALKPESRGRIT